MAKEDSLSLYWTLVSLLLCRLDGRPSVLRYQLNLFESISSIFWHVLEFPVGIPEPSNRAMPDSLLNSAAPPGAMTAVV